MKIAGETVHQLAYFFGGPVTRFFDNLIQRYGHSKTLSYLATGFNGPISRRTPQRGVHYPAI